jgi:hypothetical protein
MLIYVLGKMELTAIYISIHLYTGGIHATLTTAH